MTARSGDLTHEQIIAYVDKTMGIMMRRMVPGLPPEQKDEIRQSAHLRVLESDLCRTAPDGWKSYIQAHCKYAVLDYLRSGSGFKPQEIDGGHGGANTDIEAVEDPRALETHEKALSDVKWDLVARMAEQDLGVYIAAHVLLGFTYREIATMLGRSHQAVKRAFKGFAERLDDPELYGDAWIRQAIYALGLSEHFNMMPKDTGRVLNYCSRPMAAKREAMRAVGVA